MEVFTWCQKIFFLDWLRQEFDLPTGSAGGSTLLLLIWLVESIFQKGPASFQTDASAQQAINSILTHERIRTQKSLLLKLEVKAWFR